MALILTVQLYLINGLSSQVMAEQSIVPLQQPRTVSGLTEGTYQYQLKVTDNLGATATGAALITVLKTPATTTGKAIRVNIYGGTNPTADAKWNNWNLTAGLTSSNFLYEDKSTSTV